MLRRDDTVETRFLCIRRDIVLRCPKFVAHLRSPNFDRCHSFALRASLRSVAPQGYLSSSARARYARPLRRVSLLLASSATGGEKQTSPLLRYPQCRQVPASGHSMTGVSTSKHRLQRCNDNAQRAGRGAGEGGSVPRSAVSNRNRETIGTAVSASPARILWVLSWQDKKVPPHAVE